MNDPRFYIFGVPDGFNLFQGDPDDIGYFQLFYDGSKEHTKLTIHRKVNGQVSYAYLKYRLLSAEGRAGAFFGMSIVFNGEYCADVPKLYRLFDSVYHEIVLKGKILLDAIDGNPNLQAKFLIHTFKQQEAEVKKIEGIVLRNIESRFTEDIHLLDSSFQEAKQSFIRKLNYPKSNNAILDSLRKYSWVSISPEYAEEVIDEITQKAIKDLNAFSITIMGNIIDYYDKIVHENTADVEIEIEAMEKVVREHVATIQKYIKKQPELKDLKLNYDDILGKIQPLKKALVNKSRKNTSSGPATIVTDENISTHKRHKLVNNALIPPLAVKFKSKKRKIIRVSTIAVLLVLLTITLWWLYPRDKEPVVECEACVIANNHFQDYLKNNEFQKAQSTLVTIFNHGENVDSKRDDLSEKAERYYIAKADDNFTQANGEKIDLYNGALKLLDSAKQFAPKISIEEKKEDYKKKTIEHYESKIQTTNTISKKKEYASIILELQPNNSVANHLLNNGNVAASANQPPHPEKSCRIRVYGEQRAREASAVYSELQSKLDNNQYTEVIEACSVIINACHGEIVEKARIMKIEAEMKQSQEKSGKEQKQKADSIKN